MSAKPMLRNPDAKLATDRFDFREFMLAIMELVGLMLALVIEPGPVGIFHVWVATVHVYTIAEAPILTTVRYIRVIVIHH